MNANAGTNILIVDDDLIHRAVLSNILSNEGYHVLLAGNYDDAIFEYKNNYIDLAILDIRLPSRSGIELADDLHHVPYIYVTQVTNQNTVELALREKLTHRAMGYIVKPFNVDSVKPTIKSVLDIAKYINNSQYSVLRMLSRLEIEQKKSAEKLKEIIAKEIVQLKTCAVHLENRGDMNKYDANVVEQISTRIDNIISDYVNDIYPDDLIEYGFISAIEKFLITYSESDIECEYQVKFNTDIKVDKLIALNLYRIIQESLSNISKQSNAKNVTITVAQKNHYIEITIVSDGSGFNVTDEQLEEGVSSMRDRILALGGDFNATSQSSSLLFAISVPICHGKLG